MFQLSKFKTSILLKNFLYLNDISKYFEVFSKYFKIKFIPKIKDLKYN